jgi:hypothetical protein
MNIIVILIILFLIFGGGSGFYGYSHWGTLGGGLGLGGVLAILFVCWLLFGRGNSLP